MHYIHHFHVHRIFKIKSELEEVYLNLLIQSFALSMIGIFIPIYLLQIGFNIGIILVFMMVQFASFAIFSPITSAISSKIGLKHSILFRIPLLIIFYLFLALIGPLDIYFLFLIAFIGGISEAFYWNSLNSEFVLNSKKIHGEEEVAHLVAFPKVAAIAAPLIGALILASLGFNIIFILAMGLIVLSVLPLFATGEYKRRFKFKLKQTKKFTGKRIDCYNFLSGSIISMEGFIWPLFIFIFFKDIILVGTAASLTSIGIVVLTLFVGKFSDKIERKWLVRTGGFIYALVWFSRLIVSTPLEVVALSLFGGLTMTLIIIPSFADFSDYARRKNILATVVTREVWLNIGRVVSTVVLLIFLTQLFQVTFILMGIFSLLFLTYKSPQELGKYKFKFLRR